MSSFLYKLAGLADAFWARAKNEPVIVAWLVTSIVAVAASVNFDLPPEVVAAVLGVGAVYARSKVTPT